VVLPYTGVYSWHWAVGSEGACFLVVFMVEDKGEGWDGGVVADLGHCPRVVRGEHWEVWLWVEVFFQPLELLLGKSRQGHGLGWLSPDSNLYNR
jgi:hypothetical protein